MSMSNFLENKILNHVAGVEAFEMPTELFVALMTSSVDEEGNGIEVDAGSYERIAVTFDESVEGSIKNNKDVVFAVAQENWGSITDVAIFNSLTDGDMLFYTTLAKAQEINQDSQIIFKAEKLTISLD